MYIPWLFCLEVVDARQAIKEDKAFGVRRIFDMASRMNDPIDLSLGEPDFDIPEEIKQEGIHWIEGGVNKYTLTTGIPELRQKVKEYLQGKGVTFGNVMITVGVNGGLLLCCLCLIDSGDEVLIPDPYFVMYEYQVLLIGGVPNRPRRGFFAAAHVLPYFLCCTHECSGAGCKDSAGTLIL